MSPVRFVVPSHVLSCFFDSAVTMTQVMSCPVFLTLTVSAVTMRRGHTM